MQCCRAKSPHRATFWPHQQRLSTVKVGKRSGSAINFANRCYLAGYLAVISMLLVCGRAPPMWGTLIGYDRVAETTSMICDLRESYS
jgi:hypothetical protein